MRLKNYLSGITKIDWNKTHSTRTKVVLHLLMWTFLSILYFNGYNRFDKKLGWMFVIKDLASVMTIFYAVSYYVLPNLLFKGKIILTVISGLLCYVLYGSLTYFLCLIIDSNFNQTPRLHSYVMTILSHGITGILSWWAVSFYFLDFLYLIAPPLALKLIKLIADQSNKRISLERDNLNLEINFLKAQINPHFLFNTMNNIYRMVNKQDPKTGPMVLHFADLMRYTLYESNVDRILLSREVEFINDYLELERIRYGNDVSIKTDFQEDFERMMIVPLILFPFIENAFKHGIDATVESSWVEISIRTVDNYLHFNVNNSVCNVHPSEDFGGVGVANVKKRLNIHYAGKYKLTNQIENGIYKVNLQLPLS
ncbi:sensor histidine kinase [Pedobacter cryoconitis]|uniref:Sensor histidine kinase YesM n=1 Tax=Pedobacter cryoconitis TaxID=188932 RepID=A0A7X0MHK6_9SPHI|nr:histidine kinase [Pedobacter cryoconitis]MBB6499234.1 sensor histidine kinase YesM [Pedobacter cryoconitis]